jgi:hypothetical protein
MEDFERVAEASTDRFRLETLPTYLVPEEEEEFGAWKRGCRTLPAVDESPWLQHIRDTTEQGVTWSRIRVLDYPLTDYSTYELHGYQGNAAAGEHIFVADRSWSEELTDLHDDFWVFDHKIVIRMVYDAAGHFIRPEPVAKVHPYLTVRSIAARHAVPLATFLADNEPRLIA